MWGSSVFVRESIVQTPLVEFGIFTVLIMQLGGCTLDILIFRPSVDKFLETIRIKIFTVKLGRLQLETHVSTLNFKSILYRQAACFPIQIFTAHDSGFIKGVSRLSEIIMWGSWTLSMPRPVIGKTIGFSTLSHLSWTRKGRTGLRTDFKAVDSELCVKNWYGKSNKQRQQQ